MTDIFDFPGADKVEKPVLVIEDEALAKGFTIIPNIVFKRRDLSAYSKLVHMALLSYAWQQDSCFPGQARLADELQVSIDTIRRALRQLVSDHAESSFFACSQHGLETALSVTKNTQLTKPSEEDEALEYSKARR